MSNRDPNARPRLAALLPALLMLAAAQHASAGVTSNEAAAVLVYPYVAVDNSRGLDTFVELTSTSDSDVDVLCFYENTTAHCGGGTSACQTAGDCEPGVACEPGWSPIPFQLRLFRQQPVGWLVSQGSSPLPPPAMGDVPAAPEQPFVGALRCIVVDSLGAAVASNALIGHATLEEHRTDAKANFDVAKYNAIGMQATGGDADGDGHLILGGDGLEYAGCANYLIFDHFFDQATEPVLHASSVQTSLVLLPCSANYPESAPGQSTVSYSVTNELDTTVTEDTTLDVSGQLVVPLNSPLLQVGAQGTLTGKIRLQATGAGVIGIVLETHRNLEDSAARKSAARTVHGTGERIAPDEIVIEPAGTTPTATATAQTTETPTVEAIGPGDLDHDGSVTTADLALLIAEVFDGDGSLVADAGGGTVHSGPEADVNGDGVITAADFVALLKVAD